MTGWANGVELHAEFGYRFLIKLMRWCDKVIKYAVWSVVIDCNMLRVFSSDNLWIIYLSKIGSDFQIPRFHLCKNHIMDVGFMVS